MRRSICFLSFVGMAGLLFLNGNWGCGSSSTRGASDGTTTADTIAVTGTVSGVSASGASLSALGLGTKRAVSETALANEPCTCYNDSGVVVGTATSGSDGTYTITVDESVLNPDGEASVTETLILETDSGITHYAEVTITSDTTTITIDADPDTTLAAEALKAKLEALGFSSWLGFDFSAIALDFDPFCFVKMEEKKWELAATGESGLQGELGSMKDMMLASMGAGDFGSYGGFSGMAQAFMDGTVDTSFQATAAEHAETFTGTSSASYTAEIASAMTSFGTMADTFATNFAGGVGAGVTALKAKKGVVDASDDSLCGDLLLDDDAMREAVSTMLAAGNISEFSTTFGSGAGVENFHEVMKKFEGAGGDFAFGDNWDPKAMMGIMGGFQGDFAKFDPNKTFEMFDSLPTDTAGTFDYHSWGAAMAGDFKDFMEGGGMAEGYDPATQAGFWTAQVAGGTTFDPTVTGFDTYDFDGTFTSGTLGGSDYSACTTDPSSSACQTIVSGGGFTQGCFSNADCATGSSCNVSTGLCTNSATGEFNFVGTFTFNSPGGSCSAPLSGSTTLSGSGNSYTMTLGGAPATFAISGPGTCTATRSSVACGSCFFSGSGASGSMINLSSCGTCTFMLTKQ